MILLAYEVKKSEKKSQQNIIKLIKINYAFSHLNSD